MIQPQMNTDKHRLKKALIYLCLSVFICGSILFSVPAEEHPCLLLDKHDVDALKQKIAGPFAAQWNALRADVDREMAKPVDLPPRGGNWSHNYVCPEHGARLKQGKQIGPWEWEHICPVGPHTLHGDPSKGTTDFDGNAIMGVHLDYAQELVDLGIVYQITGDAKYAQKSREILLAYADKYESYPLHDNQGHLGSGAHVASQSLTEASWLILVAQGADLVWDTIPQADRDQIANRLLRPALTECILPHNLGIHNIQCRHNSAIGLVGFLLDDKDLIHTAIDDPKSGFRQQIAKGVRDDGMWLEGASGYHFFTIDGLVPLAEAARHAGIDLYSPRFESMFTGPLDLAMPDLRLPNFNDSGVVDLRTRSDSYDLAFARWHDDRFLPLIDHSKRDGKLELLYGVTDLPSAKPTSGEMHSRNLLASGFAILEQHAHDDSTWLCLKYGPHGGGHGHFDKNHFILWSNGTIVMPDAGTHAYGSPLHSSWDKTSLAHNTLTVDEQSQLAAEGKCLAFGSSEGVDYAVTDAGDAFKDNGVQFIRSVAMIDPNCIVVIDRIHSDMEHTLDLAVHVTGEWDALAGAPWQAPKAAGYSVLNDLTTRTIHEPLTLRSHFGRERVATITLAANEPTEVITGTGVGETTQDRVPIALLRRRAANTVYVWAIALDGSTPQLQVKFDTPEQVRVSVQRGDAHVDLLASPSGTSEPLKILQLR
jgi:hypothetical protein